MRGHYDQQLADIKHKVLRMGSMVENIIDEAVTSLKNQDIELAKKIYTDDDKIDNMEIEIEHDCVNILALQQPLARDLRTITTALRIIADLERMGDHAVNIAKVTLQIGKEKLIKPLIDIPKMAELSQKMVRMSLDAFVKEDTELAKESVEIDEQVDKLYNDIMEEVIELIRTDERYIAQGTKFLFVARYLERIGDHTTNICERIIYMITGELKEIN